MKDMRCMLLHARLFNRCPILLTLVAVQVVD
jgi:hypothetical protein